jgi:catechol 2,3-dioxygenase-like lactoylglutathione lyase family enzyme
VITGVHHLTLRVRDLAASARFYERALGIPVERLVDRCRLRVGDTVVVLREPLPGTLAGDRFSEARIGLDHIAFRIETPSELEELSKRLGHVGAEVGEPEHDPHGGGMALTFRDPDNIQLEFYLVA